MRKVGFPALSTAVRSRDDFIEILRGLSVLLVTYAHFTDRVPPSALGVETGPSVVFHGGKVAIYLSFILSGYVVALTMASSRSLGEFYAKRVSRVWPLFIVANLVIFAFLLVFSPPIVEGGPKPFYTGSRDVKDLIGSIFFLEDLGFDWVDGVFWAILVQMKFYLLVGLFAAVFVRYISAFTIFAVAAATIDLGLQLFVGDQARMAVRLLNGVLIAQYLPFFALGMCLLRGRRDALLLGVVALCLTQCLLAVGGGGGFDIRETAQFLLLLAVLLVADTILFRNRVMLVAGLYAYTIYLFHQMIGLSVMARLAPRIGIDLAIVAGIVLTVAISVPLAWAFEWRFRPQVHNLLMAVFRLLHLDRILLRAEGAAAANVPHGAPAAPAAPVGISRGFGR